MVEVTYETPPYRRPWFEARRKAGETIVLLDSRPYDDYSWITIPGAVDARAANRAARAQRACRRTTRWSWSIAGGRTRSIIGAQILIDAGLPNPVLSLKNGTQGWHLAGLEVERGANRVAPLPSPTRA